MDSESYASSSKEIPREKRHSTQSLRSTVSMAPSYRTEIQGAADLYCQDEKRPINDEKPPIMDERRKYIPPAPPTEPAPEYVYRADPEPALPAPVPERVYITRHRGVSSFLFWTLAAALLFSVLVNFVYTGIALQGILPGISHHSWRDDGSAGMNIAPIINIGGAAAASANSDAQVLTITEDGANVTATASFTTTQTTTLVTTTTASGTTSIVTTTVPTTIIRATVLETSTSVSTRPPTTLLSTRTTEVPPSSVSQASPLSIPHVGDADRGGVVKSSGSLSVTLDFVSGLRPVHPTATASSGSTATTTKQLVCGDEEGCIGE